MRNIRNLFGVGLAALLIGIAPHVLPSTTGSVVAQARNYVGTPEGAQGSQLAKQVRRKLVMLPYYGVFDNLAYSINGSQVTLYGQVVRPSTRSDAERSVARIAGVTQVVNNIKVLPLSSFDDSLRRNTLRALQRAGGLYRYFMGGNPSLHIIVDRGHVTLTGVVGSKFDRQLAYMTARGVSGSFSVTNDLRVDGESDAY
ncbi:MAG TPA: BON domain-containing protein [Pyrinomonadaceae bacterium]|nr:BON domain-containing protein [Pyrinomonadaceae bacterium]